MYIWIHVCIYTRVHINTHTQFLLCCSTFYTRPWFCKVLNLFWDHSHHGPGGAGPSLWASHSVKGMLQLWSAWNPQEGCTGLLSCPGMGPVRVLPNRFFLTISQEPATHPLSKQPSEGPRRRLVWRHWVTRADSFSPVFCCPRICLSPRERLGYSDCEGNTREMQGSCGFTITILFTCKPVWTHAHAGTVHVGMLWWFWTLLLFSMRLCYPLWESLLDSRPWPAYSCECGAWKSEGTAMPRGRTRSPKTTSSAHSVPETPRQRHPPRLRLCQQMELLLFGFILCPRFPLLELFYSSVDPSSGS